MRHNDTDTHALFDVTVKAQTALGAALAGIDLSWTINSGAATAGTTDTDGELTIPDVHAGDELVVLAEDLAYVFTEERQEITVAQDAVVTFVGSQISLSGFTSVITGSEDDHLEPVSGVTVQVTGQFNNQSASKTTVSTSAGTYKVTGLIKGQDYTVTAVKDGYSMLQTGTGASVTVHSDIEQASIQLTIVLQKQDEPADPTTYIFLAFAGAGIVFGAIGFSTTVLFTNLKGTLAGQFIAAVKNQLSSITTTSDASNAMEMTGISQAVPGAGDASVMSVADGSAAPDAIAQATDALSPMVQQADQALMARSALTACTTRANFASFLNSLTESDMANLVSSDVVADESIQSFASDLTSYLTTQGVLTAPTEISASFASGFVGSGDAAIDLALGAADDATGYALSAGLTPAIEEELGLSGVEVGDELVDVFLIVADITLCA